MYTIKRDHRKRGFVLVTYSLMLTALVAMVGLAIDAGILYLVKSRLSASVDAAALAAGRSVNLASTVALASANATTMANQFFTANFPSGYLGVSAVPTVTPTFTQELDSSGNPNGVLDIAVTASVSAPVYFMRIFGVNNVTVNSSGTATRRGLVMMLVLDISVSMNTPTTPTACQAMVTAARNFITRFSPYDRVGAVTFDYTAHNLYPISQNFGDGSLDAALAGVTCNRNTNTTAGVEMAWQQIQAQNLPLAENTIVLFTDGSPNGISADFPVRTQVDDRYGPDSSGACTSTGSICSSMATTCGAPATASTTVRGTLVQTSGQPPAGSTDGLFIAMDGDPAISIPAGCSNLNGSLTRQLIAYIPDTDIYTNSTHGVPATTLTGAAAVNVSTASGPAHNMLTRDFWIYQVNNLCSPDPTVSPNCKNVGDLWSKYPTTGSGSNYFATGTTYAGNLRPDQPNTVVAASMNTAMAEAYKIRGVKKFHTVINTIYLTGNGGDAVDREFLAVMANTPTITALPYDATSYTPYTNPAFQSTQPSGQYLVTADKNQLVALFAKLASEVLRLSN